MPWKRLPNGQRSLITGWPDADDAKMVRPNCKAAEARRYALKDPNINCFFICRERKSDKYKKNAAVFFTLDEKTVSELMRHKTSDPGQDLYVKAGMSVAFYDPGDSEAESLASACRYTTSDGDAAVDMVCIFAANLVLEIKGEYTALADSLYVESAKKSKGAIAVANKKILRVLEGEKGTIKELKQRGITVLLSFLNNHQNVGWGEVDDKDDASQFAKQLKNVMTKYGLDGVNIDDEYSAKQDKLARDISVRDKSVDKSVDESLAMMSAKLGYEFRLKNLIVTKALFRDVDYFGIEYVGKHAKFKLEDELTYGFEMSYREDPHKSLDRYVQKKMAKHKLLKGFKLPDSSSFTDQSWIDWLKHNGFAGFMVFDFQVKRGQDLMGVLVENWLGKGNWNS